MAYDTGYTSFYKLKKETAWGTAVVPDADLGLLEATGNISQTQGIEENYASGSRKNNQLTYGKYTVNGSLTGKVLDGTLLAYALGTDTPAGTEPTTHTLAVADTTDVSSFTLGQYHIGTDKGLEATGCKINDFSLSLESGGILNATYNWVGKSVAEKSSTVGTRTAPSESVLPSYVGTISWNSEEIECKSFNFNYANNLGDDEYTIGDRKKQAITQGAVGINGTFVLVFSDLTEYADFQTTWSTGVEVGTARALSLVTSTGSTTTAYELSLGMTGVVMSEVNQAVVLDNSRVVAEYSFIANALGTVTYKDQLATNYIA